MHAALAGPIFLGTGGVHDDAALKVAVAGLIVFIELHGAGRAR